MNFDKWIPLIYGKLERWGKLIITMFPNFILAAFVITTFFFISKFARRVVSKFVLRISKSEALSGLFSVLLQSLILIFGLMTALDILNLDKTVSSILAGVGIIGLALGFAFQDLTSNFISGTFMALRRPFEVGDKVETNGFVGTIHHIQLRATTLFTTQGLHVIIPNKDIFQKPIINYSRSEQRRVELEFAVLSSSDLEFIESLVRQALQGVGTSRPVEDIDVFFTAIDEPKIKLIVSFHINNAEPKSFFTTRHKAIIAIYKTFANNGIVKITTPGPNPPVTAKQNA